MKKLSEHVASQLQEFNVTLPVDEATMPPATWYTDTDFLKAELDLVFRNTWQPIMRRDQINGVNTYKSGTVGKIPWVVTRGPDHKLRAFYNICRHKGREVVCKDGTSKSGELVCGYHGWSFGIDGQLKSAPQIGGIKNFKKENTGLVPMAICEWGHWIFVNGDVDATPISEDLSDLNKQLINRNWERLQYHSHKYWTINCNCKAYIDNYLDGGYHIPHMHPTLDAQLKMDSYQTDCFPKYSIQTSGGASARIGAGSIYAWIYPNFMINLYGNCLDINYVIPINEDQCQVYYEFYFHDLDGEEQKSLIGKSIKQADITQVEDIEICESVQKGLQSGAYIAGRYAPGLEKGEHHFHLLLCKDLSNSK